MREKTMKAILLIVIAIIFVYLWVYSLTELPENLSFREFPTIIITIVFAIAFTVLLSLLLVIILQPRKVRMFQMFHLVQTIATITEEEAKRLNITNRKTLFQELSVLGYNVLESQERLCDMPTSLIVSQELPSTSGRSLKQDFAEITKRLGTPFHSGECYLVVQ